MKAKFHLPALFSYFEFYQYLLDIYFNEREKFRDWIEIDGIFGSPAYSIWNSGRGSIVEYYDHTILNEYMSSNNIGCEFTFSNNLLTEENLNDTRGNQTLKLFHSEKNSIVLSSPILEKYIRKNYPKYKIVSSTTKCITDIDKLKKELQQNYHLVCLDYNFNNDFMILDALGGYYNKCEILVNPVCDPKCQNRQKHYNIISQISLGNQFIDSMECPCVNRMFYEVQKNPLFVSIDNIKQYYLPIGIFNFKIEGRLMPYYNLIEILTYYLVKPEFQLEIRQRLLLFFH